MLIAHLTASTFHGGPERQMLGLARSLPPRMETLFLCFAERGRCAEFLSVVRQQGFEGIALKYDSPHLFAATQELTRELRERGVNVLCCHGYKADLLGRIAARRAGIPVVAVSRGWTGESFKVRLYERLDRLLLRWMDRVVCVSESQARKVRAAGVPNSRVLVVHNAIDSRRFQTPDPLYRERLVDYFPHRPRFVIGAAGRLSPEKGFSVLVKAANVVLRTRPDVGFIHFGDGPLRSAIVQQIDHAGLQDRFILAGMRADLDRFTPFFDLAVLPSFTEGLPNVVLEALAAGVPVVATDVGGTPEVIEEGVNGSLVPPGDAELLAKQILQALTDPTQLREMGRRGRTRVEAEFTFAVQAQAYSRLFRQLQSKPQNEPTEVNGLAARLTFEEGQA